MQKNQPFNLIHNYVNLIIFHLIPIFFCSNHFKSFQQKLNVEEKTLQFALYYINIIQSSSLTLNNLFFHSRFVATEGKFPNEIQIESKGLEFLMFVSCRDGEN